MEKRWNGGSFAWLRHHFPWKHSWFPHDFHQRCQLPPVVSPDLQDEGPGGHGTDHVWLSRDSFGPSNLSWGKNHWEFSWRIWPISGKLEMESKTWEKFGVKTTGKSLIDLIGSFLIGTSEVAMGPNVSAAAYPSSEKQSVDRLHLADFAHFRATPVEWNTTSPCQKFGHPDDILYPLVMSK